VLHSFSFWMTVEDHRRNAKQNLFPPPISKGKVPVAQPDRASDFGSEGWGFESLQARSLTSTTYARSGVLKKKVVWQLLATFKAEA
jgi:hypothetical protein